MKCETVRSGVEKKIRNIQIKRMKVHALVFKKKDFQNARKNCRKTNKK